MAFVFEANSLKSCANSSVTLFSMDIVEGGKKLEILPRAQTPVKTPFLRGDKTDHSFCLYGISDYVVPANKGMTLCRDNQGGKNLEQSGLSGPVGADERKNMAFLYTKTDVLKHKLIAKALCNAYTLDCGIFPVHDRPL
jgi:hypothetical protein